MKRARVIVFCAGDISPGQCNLLRIFSNPNELQSVDITQILLTPTPIAVNGQKEKTVKENNHLSDRLMAEYASQHLGRSGERTSSGSGTFVANMKLPVHGWFRYSAGFSAEWVEEILVENSSAQTILDPFTGSGTTLLAAQMAGKKSVGYEPHPFVHRIASAKLNWRVDYRAFVEAAEVILENAKKRDADISGEFADLIYRCYDRDTLGQLHSIKEAYFDWTRSNREKTISELLFLAITSILRSCSHAGTATWQYVLPNKSKSRTKEPRAAFRDKISQMADDIFWLSARSQDGNAVVKTADARTVSQEPDSVDLVITSPPYPNNYDYADATRLEMTFWGEIDTWGDLHEKVRSKLLRSCSQHSSKDRLELEPILMDPILKPISDELGSICRELGMVRLQKGGKKTYHTMVAAYFLDLAKIIANLRISCRDGSRVCFVIGDSAPYGVYVPTDELMGKLFISCGFKKWSFEKTRDRNIKWKNRKHTVPLKEGNLWIEG